MARKCKLYLKKSNFEENARRHKINPESMKQYNTMAECVAIKRLVGRVEFIRVVIHRF